MREYRKQDGGHGVSVDMRADQLDLMGGGQRQQSRSNDVPAPSEQDEACPF